MKHIIERFLCMKTEDVLDSFASLPGAEVHKQFIFIPGSRSPDKRILFVGHADTVFTRPPRSIEWYGNFARTSHMSPKFPEGPFRTRAKIVTPVVPTPSTIQSEDGSAVPPIPPDQTEEVKSDATSDSTKPAEATTNDGGKKKKKKKGGNILDKKKEWNWDDSLNEGYVIIEGKRMSIPEYRTQMMAEKATTQPENSTSSPSTTTSKSTTPPKYQNWSGGQHSYGGGYRDGGLGADDRVGIAMMWLMRNSGHSILITDGEESGGIGAKAAARAIPEKLSEHVFAVEVDRQMDMEMVFYDVSTKDFEKYMTEHSGFVTRMGSYTDIKDVCTAAGICGVNLAAGYWGQHSSSEAFCYDAWLRTYKVVRHLAFEADLKKFMLPQKSYSYSSHSTNHRVPETNPSKLIGPTLNGKSSTEPSTEPKRPLEIVKAENKASYKGGPRFLSTAEKSDNGIAIIRTTIDPKTGQKTTVREPIETVSLKNGSSASDVLFPEGSAPIETALDDLMRQVAHQATDDGMPETQIEKSGVEPQLDLVTLHEQNAPLM